MLCLTSANARCCGANINWSIQTGREAFGGCRCFCSSIIIVEVSARLPMMMMMVMMMVVAATAGGDDDDVGELEDDLLQVLVH